jgi:predicted ATPase/DNA-binding SARP family transcriptional activator
MRFGVLGPLAVWAADGNLARIPELKVRGVLADLLVHAGRPVPVRQLVDDLWGDLLPENPTAALQTRVSQLRRALDAAETGARELVVSQPPGYLLRVEPDAVDEGRFRALVRRARAAGDPRVRASMLAEALALWRGPAYADFDDAPFARWAIDRLEEERLVAEEERAEARLELGEHALLVGDLAVLAAQHPLRQRLRAAQMRALYRSGRHSEALDTYRELRGQLADQLGLEPAAELVALEQAILRQDPGLVVPPSEASVPTATNMATATTRPRTNLPAMLTSLIGQDAALVEVRARLAEGRLVTLTGPGGVGKTRLAVEVAGQLVDAYADGVWLVDLAALGQGAGAGQVATAMLVRLITGTLGRDVTGAPAADAGDPAEELVGRLCDQEMLLVLDNCEHLLDPVAKLSELLLRAAPRVRILATTREPLRIQGELLWEVPPLALPDRAAVEPAELEQSAAVRLFVTRVAATVPGFRLDARNASTVAGICRRLDGIPLSLELAATQVRALGVKEIAARLDDRFRLLSAGLRGAPARQQTLRAVIDWSWRLLTEQEQAVLRRVGPHAGTWTLQAAEAVCAGDGVDAVDVPPLLARLVDRSLVARVEAPAGVRYRLLESVRAYCLERLRESGEHEHLQQRHADYFACLSSRAEPLLYGHHELLTHLTERPPQQEAFPVPGGQAEREPSGRVRSGDATPIAYDRSGKGPPLILIGGALNDRRTYEPLAASLGRHLTVLSYDRRGRGASGDTSPYRVECEIEDLQALVQAAGGSAYAFGVSSGAVLAVQAAARGVHLTRLVLAEPPFILDDTRSQVAADLIPRLEELISSGRRGDAVELFLTEAIEMPLEVVAPMRSAPTWPVLEALAHTIVYDLTIMGDFTLPTEWASVTAPTLVLVGQYSASWRQNTARATASTLPNGVLRSITGHPHDAPPEVLAPILLEFLSGQ